MNLSEQIEQWAAAQQGRCADTGLAAVTVSGADATDFLQGQLTADLRKLPDAAWMPAAWCTPKGRVWTTLQLRRDDGGYTLLVPASLRDELLRRMAMFVLRAKVSLSASGQTVTGTVGGDQGEVLPPGTRCRVRLGDAVHDGAVDADSWRALRMLDGALPFGPELQDRWLPQMLNMDRSGGLDFNKGCYPGQEPIARVHYKGRVARRMVLLALPSGAAIEQGAEVSAADGGKQGEVAASVTLPGFRLIQAVVAADAESSELFVAGEAATGIAG